MASHYSFKATVSEAELSIPSAQTFLERSEGSYREGERGEGGGGDAQSTLVPKRAHSG